MDVGICDDDQACQLAISQLIKEQHVPEPINIMTFSTLEALLGQTKLLDLLFLDIEVGEVNSIDCLNQYKELQRIPSIVLVSSHSCYTTKSYQATIFQYLLKPVYPEIFEQVFSACYERYQRLQQICTLQDEHGLVWRIPLHKIVCIKIERRRLVYYDEEQKEYWGATQSLTRVLDKLKLFGFCQIAKDCLVNLAYVTSVENNFAVIKLKCQVGKLAVGKKYLEEAKRQYLRYLVD